MLLLVGNWWAFVLRGIVAILFGLIAFAVPGMALLTLVFLFGFYALADGVFALIAAFRRTHRDQQPWWALLIHGIVGIAAGLIAFLMPGITALALLYLIAAWAVVTGVLQIVAAIRLRKQITGEWVLALSGALSIVFGVLLFLFPGPGALAVVFWIGAYAIVMGILMITLGVRLRKWIRAAAEPPPGAGGHGYPAPAH